MAGKSNSRSGTGAPRTRSAVKVKGLNTAKAKPASRLDPHRGDSDERIGKGGSATRGRGQVRRGGKTPSRSKD